MRKRTLTGVLLTAALVLMMMSPALSIASEKEMKIPVKAVELRMTLRDLWIGHIFWVRSVVFATESGDAGAAKVAEENVVKNAKDIAAAVGSFYGKEAGDKLFGLLAGHYGAIKEYLTASMAGNKEGKDAAVTKLKKNAEEIAVFLNGANPKNWPKDTLVSLLLAHGAHHIAQIDAVAAKDYTAEATDWDAMRQHIYMIADALASGIAKQFPKKF
ncbi:MAG TPA: hypothetical protein VK654_17215 [Nitrospirota bacterium]|nr:hypothetical protein [Nitrospirota bacterium]